MIAALLCALCISLLPVGDPVESDHYALVDVPIPEGVVLEVGGLLPLADGRLLVCTRRGDLWALDDPLSETPAWSLWADGLAEPLGLLAGDDGEILVVQRGELSALSDSNGDGVADHYRTVCDDWEISGSYHEYAFGPTRDGDGKLWVTLNRPFDNEPFGSVDWRGWAVTIDDDGTMTPVCAGLRSPAGVAASPWGDVFYTDNQGEWCGASKLSLLSPGSFHGHPWGIDSCERPGSGVTHPGELPDGTLMPLAAANIDNFAMPSVWFPYDVMGRSPSGFCWDETDGAFGPFAGQLFVGDQYQASILRVSLEQVDGHWQGACFPFRRGLASGVIRVRFARDGSLIAGASDRGWPSLGESSFGLQRLVYTGVTPFEMLTIEARPQGFAVRFTEPVDPATASDPSSWAARRFTYRLHSDYGSDETDPWDLDIVSVTVAADGLSAELLIEGLAEGYVHALSATGVRSVDGRPLLHDEGFYTLVERPGPTAAPLVVIAADHNTRAVADQLAAQLVQDGLACQVIDPHEDPPSLMALRDAALAVLLTGDLALDEEQRAPLMTYADGGHGWLAAGAGLSPLAGDLDTEADPDAAEDEAWLAQRLASREQPWSPTDGTTLESQQGAGGEPVFWRTGADRQRILAADLDPSDPTNLPALAAAALWAVRLR